MAAPAAGGSGGGFASFASQPGGFGALAQQGGGFGGAAAGGGGFGGLGGGGLPASPAPAAGGAVTNLWAPRK